jgi:hypothetical protein
VDLIKDFANKKCRGKTLQSVIFVVVFVVILTILAPVERHNFRRITTIDHEEI